MPEPIRLSDHASVVFFIGAGMSAESGMPTYRGRGGIWWQYHYEDYACQRAFDRAPERVLEFHEIRRGKALSCAPHAGHAALAQWQRAHPALQVITQNIDGLLQRAGVRVTAELHGSLWRQRCGLHGVREDREAGTYRRRRCEHCDGWLRPDITWFEDMVDGVVFERAASLIDAATLFVSVGTSAVVYPAAGFIERAAQRGLTMVEINPEPTAASDLFTQALRAPASALDALLRA